MIVFAAEVDDQIHDCKDNEPDQGPQDLNEQITNEDV
uniref:Uncharacterized protein n=1 Tax=Solanum lycopersicum TaxID=4081 RepID=K4D0Y2_SOLLC